MQIFPNVMFTHIQVKKEFKILDNIKDFNHLDKGEMP